MANDLFQSQKANHKTPLTDSATNIINVWLFSMRSQHTSQSKLMPEIIVTVIIMSTSVTLKQDFARLGGT